MRKFFFLLVLASVFTTAQAQESKSNRKMDWGLRSGINFSTLRFKVSADATSYQDPSWKTGFVFGAFLGVKINNEFSIQPEFLYSSMGSKNTNAINGQSSYLRLNYFSIPVLARYRLAKNLAAVAGPQFDFLITARQVVDDESMTVEGTYDDNSVNVTGGIEFWPSTCIGVTARYIHGLSNISAVEESSIAIKNRGIQVTLALKF